MRVRTCAPVLEPEPALELEQNSARGHASVQADAAADAATVDAADAALGAAAATAAAVWCSAFSSPLLPQQGPALFA